MCACVSVSAWGLDFTATEPESPSLLLLQFEYRKQQQKIKFNFHMRRCSAAHTKYCLSDVICMEAEKRARSAATASSCLAVEQKIYAIIRSHRNR